MYSHRATRPVGADARSVRSNPHERLDELMTGEQHRQRRQRQLSPPVDLAQGADTDATDNDACNKVGLG
jgi:hypothetical protein